MRHLLLLPALTASAVAAPFIQSTASVAEGNFCKTHGCRFVGRTVVGPETMNTLRFEYRVGNGTLTVGRLSNMEIFSGSLAVRVGQWNTPAVRDFFRTFAGLTPEPSTLRACLKRALSTRSPYSTPISSGTVGATGYRADCQAQKGGL